MAFFYHNPNNPTSMNIDTELSRDFDINYHKVSNRDQHDAKDFIGEHVIHIGDNMYNTSIKEYNIIHHPKQCEYCIRKVKDQHFTRDLQSKITHCNICKRHVEIKA